jgi:O-antigen/teichoic acid export membrane protein
MVAGVLYWIDSFMIGIFKSAVEVGFYNSVVPIALLLDVTPGIFLKLFFPMITKEYSLKNLEFIREIAKQIGKWIFMINLPICLLIIFFPGLIIKFLFGSEYLVAITSLRFLAAGGLISSIFVISENLISMMGKSKVIFYDILIASLLNLFLNFILVPKPMIFGIENSLGINGAAIATTISILVCNLLFLVQAKYYTSVIPLKTDVYKIFLASLISIFVVIFLKRMVSATFFSLILLLITFFLLYIFFLLLFKAFDEKDIMILKSLRMKLLQHKYI